MKTRDWRCGDASMRKTQPLSEGEQAAGDKQDAEDEFVVACEPVGKINVEVGGDLRRVAGGQIAERATASIDGEHETLKQDNDCEDRSKPEVVYAACNRNGQDAGNQEKPDHGVEKLDGDHDPVLLCKEIHEKNQSTAGSRGAGVGISCCGMD